MSEYYNFGKTNLQLEPFELSNDAPINMTMNTDIRNMNVEKARDELIENPLANYKGEIRPPNSYGYIGSIPEVRNKDAMEIINQQQSILAISAVAGISLIVFGILVSASNNR